MSLRRRISIATTLAILLALLATGVACRRSGGDGGSTPDASTGPKPFEGTLEMIIPGARAQPPTFFMKGGKVRWNLAPTNEAAGYRLYDGATRRLFMVAPTVPAIFVGDLPAPSWAGLGGTSGGAWSFVSLGADTVAGYPCERLRATDGSSTYTICAARGLPAIPLEYTFPDAATVLPFLAALQARAELPLDVVRTDDLGGGGEGSPTLLTIQLRRAPIDDARFTLPKVPETVVRLSPPREVLR